MIKKICILALFIFAQLSWMQLTLAQPVTFSNSDFKEARAEWDARKNKLLIAFYNRNLSNEEIITIETEKSLAGGYSGTNAKHKAIADSILAYVLIKTKEDYSKFDTAYVKQYSVSLQKPFPGLTTDSLSATRLETGAKNEILEFEGNPHKNEIVKFAAKGSENEAARYQGLAWNVSTNAPIVIVRE